MKDIDWARILQFSFLTFGIFIQFYLKSNWSLAFYIIVNLSILMILFGDTTHTISETEDKNGK